MGRGATLNGNGRAVLPPGAQSPVARYRQPPPRRRGFLRTAGVVLGWLVVALSTTAAGVAGGVYLYAKEETNRLQATTPEVKVAAKKLDTPLPGQPATALVIGYDRRYAGADKGNEARSDTIMLIRADPETKSISMLSFPRDLWVDIWCKGRRIYASRINGAYTACGPQGTLETVQKLTGLKVNYLITVNFRGFVRIVDKLGGVWIDVDRRYFNDRSGPGGYATINLHPGYQQLNGYQTLDYVRYRHTDSDIYRLARQQLFVRSFKDQVRSAFSPLDLLKVTREITRNVQVVAGGDKEISLRTVTGYALFAYQLPPGHFFQSKLQGLEENSSFDLFASQENIRAAVQEFANPDVESPEKATAVALGIKPKAKAPPPRDTTVTVLNGNGVTGSATNAGYLLGQRGYQTVLPPNGAPANAPSFDYFQSKVYFDASKPGAKEAAAKVANLFGAADTAKLPPAVEPLSNEAMLTVVVGQTFHGNLAAAPVDRTPRRQPAQVAAGPSASLELLRERQPRMPFPLMVPTVLASGSWIDSERPVRMYRIDPERRHKTVRLTYRTGANEYYGVQMTNWGDAPVLSEANVKRRIGGRTYELHYSGPHLHMVVLRTPRATYWVTNTLLDSLSNETMLAIAKGLKPVSSLR